ncbi:MAG: fasciclin domain-containing protein, partial [Anaerolineae bacterium]|nr:fasciclin domain-containing protein [Anaerolineae bacterium]
MRLLSRLLLIVLLTVIALVPAGAQTQTIAAAVAANADLSTLFTVLATSGLLEAMDSPDVELTLFAPTNVAFDAVPSEALDALQADPVLLMRVLTYHVVEANLASGDLLTAASAPTLVVEALEDPGMGGELAFTAGGDSLLVNGVHIITADIAASNGVIHVIDA